MNRSEKKAKRRRARLEKRAKPKNRPSKPRTCGPCFACCKIFHVDDLPEYEGRKPAGETCKWVTDNESARCGTYTNRPEVCGFYECLWIKDGSLPTRTMRSEDRPDIIGALFDLTGPEHLASKALGRPVVVARAFREGAYEEEAFNAAVTRFMERGHVVVLTRGFGDYEFRALNWMDAQRVAEAYRKTKQFKVIS